MDGPYGFDRRSVEKLAAALRNLQLQFTNMQRSLVATGVQRHQGVFIPGLKMARLTETLDDTHKAAKAKKWAWSATEEDYVATDREITLRCFLRPAGETIEALTRVYYARIGKFNEIIVVGCSPDSE